MIELEYPPGATPLDDDELAGLIPDHVTTRDQVNQLEQANLLIAERWISKARIKRITDPGFLFRLHAKMFGNVWRWAGERRRSEKNIGVVPDQIGIRLLDLCRDVDAWIEHRAYPPDEIAARFHHRLVAIHPFANGNGRHARKAADLLLERVLGNPAFTWGSGTLMEPGETRTRYIEALRAADGNDYAPLLKFVRT